jgi:hypothetical protein
MGEEITERKGLLSSVAAVRFESWGKVQVGQLKYVY